MHSGPACARMAFGEPARGKLSRVNVRARADAHPASSAEHAVTLPHRREDSRAQRALTSVRVRLAPQHAALALVLALAGVLDLHALARSGYANIFYSAAVRSELLSVHNLLFLSSDPSGLISVDKPPLGVWLQVASARVFGFSPLSLLVPEALAAVLGVAVLYRILTRRLGPTAALAGALTLAVFPSFVAVARDNGPDPLLILFMLLAALFALTAIERGRLRSLLMSAVMVGLAFNTKTLAALLVVPGLALGYLLCAPVRVPRRLVHLLVAGLVLVVVSGAWIAFVDLTPASQRPYVGGSTDNSEVNLTFSYNGVGRVGGQVGGPGRVPHVHRGVGALSAVGAHHRHARRRAPVAGGNSPSSPLTPTATRRTSAAQSGVPPIPKHGRSIHPVAFGGPVGPLRLLGTGLGDQGGWLLPFAAVGLVGLAVTVRTRRGPRLGVLLVLGGWFLAEAAVLSFSKGIVHPYYVSALGPGLAAMVGAGALALTELARRASWLIVLPVAAVAGTVGAQYLLLQRENYLLAWIPVLAVLALVALLVMLLSRRWAPWAMAAVLTVLLVAPAAYSSTVWGAPTDGTFPAAGPHAMAGFGGLGVSPSSEATNRALRSWVAAHRPGSRWAVLTEASDTAAPLTLLGLRAAALGGYSATDPAVDAAGLARLVDSGQARYVWLGGAYSGRGGNAAIRATPQACRYVPADVWRGAGRRSGLSLWDCAGRGVALRAAATA